MATKAKTKKKTKMPKMSFDDRAVAHGQKTLKQLGVTPAKLTRIEQCINLSYAAEFTVHYTNECAAGASDNWPYSPMMRQLVTELNERFKLELTQWHVWEIMMAMRKKTTGKPNRLVTGQQLGFDVPRSKLPMYDGINMVAKQLGCPTLERCGVSKAYFRHLTARIESMHAAIMAEKIDAHDEAAFMLDHWPGTKLFDNFAQTVNHPKAKRRTHLQKWHVWAILLRMRKDKMLSMGGPRKRTNSGFNRR